MKRFLAVLAILAIGSVVYVATAPAGQKAAGPTAAQFAALKKQVTKLQKQVKSAQSDTDALAGFVLACMAHQPVAIDRVGSSTSGYLFGAPGTPPASATATTALDLAPSTEAAPQYRVFVVNTSDSSCVSIINSALGHGALHQMSALSHR